MHRLAVAWLALLTACGPAGRSPGRAALPDRAALTSQLTRQFLRAAEAWNRGDLDAFVSDYAEDSTTTFIAGGHLRHGYAFIREMYAPRFVPGAVRDSLRFEEFEVRPLSPSLALVTARWVLYRSGGTASSGPFTLLMERHPDGWKILHDHSSSDPQ